MNNYPSALNNTKINEYKCQCEISEERYFKYIKGRSKGISGCLKSSVKHSQWMFCPMNLVSTIFRHLNSENHKFDFKFFSILDIKNNFFIRMIIEMVYIQLNETANSRTNVTNSSTYYNNSPKKWTKSYLIGFGITQIIGLIKEVLWIFSILCQSSMVLMRLLSDWVFV